MSKIFLVRHGQDTDNAAGVLNGRRDTELTELGREQAKKVAEKLCSFGIQKIYASPLKRAHETASIIASELGIDEIISDVNLMERDFGILTGKPIADISKYADKILPTDRVNYFLEADGAEDFPTLLERGRKILEKIKQDNQDKNTLIATHGDIGKMIRAAHYDLTWEEGLKTTYFENTAVLELLEMKTIKFRRHLAEEVIAGRKKSTWRLFDDKNLSVGDKVDLLYWETKEKFADAEIINAYEKKISEIREEDFDGHEKFESEEKMFEDFKKYYGDKVSMDSLVKIVRFKLL